MAQAETVRAWTLYSRLMGTSRHHSVCHSAFMACTALFNPVFLGLQACSSRLSVGARYGDFLSARRERARVLPPSVLRCLWHIPPFPSAHIKSCCTSSCPYLLLTPSSFKAEADLCLLTYLAQCLTFTELSINVR